MRTPATVALLFAAAFSFGAPQDDATTHPNVLFIAVDDLRPELGCYGNPRAITPHMDELAASGVRFDRAYCQQAVCAPSRASLLTGKRPDATRVYDLKTHFRKALPHTVPLPQHFKQNGYLARSVGKIYHGGLDDPPSWSGPPYEQTTSRTQSLRDIAETGNGLKAAAGRGEPDPRARSWAISNQPDEALRDGQIATGAIELMREMKDQPFFLAVGFVKPHLPFVAPKKYFDLHPAEKFLPPQQATPPEGAPQIAGTNFGELRSYQDIPSSGPLSNVQTRDLIRAYYAATSYADAQVGRVLDELDRLGLRERTIVVLWGDHGYHLGEMGLWNKHTNFELAAHVPLIFRSPNQKQPGASTNGLAELVDVYPTLCDLAGLQTPEDLEGSSLAPFILRGSPLGKVAAFCQYPRKAAMGYSVRSDGHRYTEWRKPGGEVLARELYDYGDTRIETQNLADQAEHQLLQDTMTSLLHQQWPQPQH